MAIQTGTPVQRGVGYDAIAARTFASGAIVPIADTYTETPDADGSFTGNQEAAWDNFGTANHRLVVRGDFKIKSGTNVPVMGDVLEDNSTPADKFVVSEAPEVKNFNPTTGQPLIVGLVLVYAPAIHTAEGGS